MQSNVTMNLSLNNISNITVEEDNQQDIRILAQSYTMYKFAEGLNRSYFFVVVPVGVIGNLLSFLIMIQKHNRHMSFSLYISVLAVTDTMSLLNGFASYLRQVHRVDFPPNPEWNCKLANTIGFTSALCSTLFILSMTFDRFYSIIRPHKAASFNTVKRAKITITCIIVTCIICNFPHAILTIQESGRCIPYGRGANETPTQIYYWFNFMINFALPFVLLLIMNSFIIQTLRNRAKFNLVRSESHHPGQGQPEGQSSKKNAERQISITLLSVTFGFLILTTPAYVLPLYIRFYGFGTTPVAFAGYFLFYHIAQKTLFTNFAINFFLYVISGDRFRTDLVKLFHCAKERPQNRYLSQTTELSTVSTTVKTSESTVNHE